MQVQSGLLGAALTWQTMHMSVSTQLQEGGRCKARAHLTLSAQLHAIANPSPLPIGPTVIQKGTALVAESVLMPDFLWSYFLDKVIDGEITEYCWSDRGGRCLPDKLDEGLAEPRVQSRLNFWSNGLDL